MVKFLAGIVAGLIISGVDNFAFQGEVSPVVIVALLLVVTVAAGAMWGKSGAFPSLVAWICLPAVHVIKHALGLRDTIHPNTYASILALGLFSLAVSCFGFLVGWTLNKAAARQTIT